MSEIDTIMKSLYCVGLLVADGRGVITQVDESFYEFYGISVEELKGKNVFDLEKAGVFSPSSVTEVLKTGKETTLKQKVKNGREVIVTAFPICEKDVITKVVTFSMDLSGYNKIKEKYEDMAQQLAEISYEKNIISNFKTKNNELKETLLNIQRVAKYDINILLMGETGVGKTIMAKRIHNISSHSKGQFIEINCGAMPDNLIESELFGYEKGAFTGANSEGSVGLFRAAENGTVFLDEVSEMSIQSQVKLLKVLQDQEVRPVGGTKSYKINCRLICASNKDLADEVQSGNFRQDLFYRINAVTFTIPPIRECKEDISALSKSILVSTNMKYGMNRFFDPNVLSAFMGYRWPGNVRELENTIVRMVITSKSDIMGLELLPEPIKEYLKMKDDTVLPITAINDLDKALEKYEASIIKSKYKTSKTSVKLAEALNITQTRASRKIRKYINKK